MEKVREGEEMRVWKIVNEVGNVAVVKAFKNFLGKRKKELL